jgi:hypothetical protein
MPSKKTKLRSTNTTGYRGVSKIGERFQAQIRINKKLKYLGMYDTPKEAAVAYDRAVIEYNLSKDKLNWPDGYPKLNTNKKKRKLSNNTTGYKGVTKRGKRFIARIPINKKRKHLGRYDTPEEAAVAYDRAVIKYNLSKDKLNFSYDIDANSTEEEGQEEKEEQEEQDHEQEQEVYWNSIIEQKEGPFEKHETTVKNVKKKKDFFFFKKNDDGREVLWL